MTAVSKDTHAAGVSAHLTRAGFEKYRPDKTSGYVASQWWDQEPFVVAVRMRYLGRKSQQDLKYVDEMAAVLEGLGFVTKQGWDEKGRPDPSVVLVSKQPFYAPYEEQVETVVDASATQEELREAVAKLLNQGKQLAATPNKDGYVLHDADGAPFPALYLTWSPSRGVTDEEQLAKGRSKVVAYHRLLQSKIPSALIAQDGDPYGCILVAAHRNALADTFRGLIEHSWERAVADMQAVQENAATEAEFAALQEPAPIMHDGSGAFLVIPAPPQADVERSLAVLNAALDRADELSEEIPARPELGLWEGLQDLFLTTSAAEQAVREIGSEHTAARDTAASGMERRLYHQALLAVAAGHPDSQELARIVLDTQHLFFDRP